MIGNIQKTKISMSGFVNEIRKQYLIKYSTIEAGRQWWFLNEVDDFQHFEWCTSKTMLKMLKDIRCARFVKRYSSEEILNIDVDLMYGEYEMKHVS